MKLNEHFITAWNEDTDLKQKYFDQVINILETSYKSIGGLVSLENNEEILKKNYIWKLVVRSDKVTACVLYKGVGDNRKIALAGTDGSTQGKNDLNMILKEDIKLLNRGVWGELSGALEHTYVDKLGGMVFPAVVSKEIMKLLGKQVEVQTKPFKDVVKGKGVELQPDSRHYIRDIGGKPHRKAIVGNVPMLYIDKVRNNTFKDNTHNGVDDDVDDFLQKYIDYRDNN